MSRAYWRGLIEGTFAGAVGVTLALWIQARARDYHYRTSVATIGRSFG